MPRVKLERTQEGDSMRAYEKRFGHRVPPELGATDRQVREALETGEPVKEWARYAETPPSGSVGELLKDLDYEERHKEQ